MTVRRPRRVATLDEFLTKARELAKAAREGHVDVETLITRLAEAVAEKTVQQVVEVLRREVMNTAGGNTQVQVDLTPVIIELRRLNETLALLVERIEKLEKTVNELSIAAGGLQRQKASEEIPPWARRLLKELSEKPYVRVHEAGVNPHQLRSNPDILRKLGGVLVETSSGVYLVKREEWLEVLKRLEGVRVRDEEEALRVAGPLAEVIHALLRENMIYYNNGWRVLREAYFDPQG